jgi:hypothetical protein
MYVLLYLIHLGMLSEANLPVDETYCLLVIDQLIFPLQVLGGLGGMESAVRAKQMFCRIAKV